MLVPRPTQSPINGYGGGGDKATKAPPTSIAEVNEWIYISTSLLCLRGVHRENVLFAFVSVDLTLI
jgi:hypothetical protein